MLKVIEQNFVPEVVLRHDTIELYIRSGATREQKEKVLHKWYRQQLRAMIISLIVKVKKKEMAKFPRYASEQ